LKEVPELNEKLKMMYAVKHQPLKIEDTPNKTHEDDSDS
jgi:hypothetical protein